MTPAIDLREKDSLVEYDPTDFWLLIKRIICSGFSFCTLDGITADQCSTTIVRIVQETIQVVSVMDVSIEE